MAVITISRESGSGGTRVAELVAARLGHHLVDDRFLQSILQQYGMADFKEVYDAAAGLSARLVGRRGEVTEMLNRVLFAVARHGDAIILGRGGYAALREVSDALHVRVQAPLMVRAQRILERGHASSIDAARELAAEGDKRRATFVKLSYGRPWDSTHDFDLVVDTGKLSVEAASALVAGGAVAMSNPDVESLLPARDLTVDAVLADSVAEALGCKTRHFGNPGETNPARPAEDSAVV